MSTRRLRRPSPALVISLLALVVALGGTSYAAFKLPRNSVGTKQLKNKAVTTKKIDNGAVTEAKLNLSGVTVPHATDAARAEDANALGGAPASAFEPASKIMTAVVDTNGTTATVVRGTPGVTATRDAAGFVDVFFPRDVSGCTWIATQGPPGEGLAQPIFAMVRRYFNASTKLVQVVTYDSTGTAVDAPFHLAVIC